MHDMRDLQSMVGVDTLQELQDRFSEVTGLAAVITDASGEPVTQTSRFSPLCHRIRATPVGLARCFASDAEGGQQAALAQKPCVYTCHAGLRDAGAPIVVDGQFVGSVLCGQVLPAPLNGEICREIAARLADTGITPDEVEQDLQSNCYMPEDRFQAAANLLYVLANSIVNLVASSLAQRRLAEETRIRMGMEKSLKESQLRVLQSQINPHFLFNTLNTVARMALFEGAHKTEELAYRMTRILRFSLSRIDRMVTLGQELDNVKDYLEIQQTRFGSRLRFKFDLDPEIMQARIPILTVQPLVENAVVRGLEPLPEGGEVSVLVWRDGDLAVVEVIDDGIGLAHRDGNAMLYGHEARNGEGHTTGLGVPNVHQRLQHAFGSRYGLRFLPMTRGTRVRVAIPLAPTHGGIDNGV
ncbi:MAG TPA: PocR ligand-binding domain-containing protein [Symbiobacteriaceae bacterium]|nr:PocR ligand-binding domain-containing protein [Symbiobacteriaceae bacterium]